MGLRVSWPSKAHGKAHFARLTCRYINSFVHSHDTADKADLIYKNHRFQMLDRAEDWERVQQYRLLEVRDDDGKRVTELELEVSSVCEDVEIEPEF